MNLTINHDGLVLRIISQVTVMPDIDGESVTVSALWDTGAMFSMLNDSIAKKLNLLEIGNTRYRHADGVSESSIYVGRLELQGGLEISDIELLGLSDIHDFDVLIGMDIISQGDFRVRNENWNTVFTFNC